jgi:hypothetical protein
MTLFSRNGDDMHTDGQTIGSTGVDVPLVTAPAETSLVVQGAYIYNNSASPVTVVLQWTDGTNDYVLYNQSLAANGSITLQDLIPYIYLFPTYALEINVGTINVIETHVCYSDVPPEGQPS